MQKIRAYSKTKFGLRKSFFYPRHRWLSFIFVRHYQPLPILSAIFGKAAVADD
jgi:hypothetical protein